MCTIGDILAVHIENRPSVYARIDFIEPDTKKDWWRVHLLLLGFPPQKVVWILREEYLAGKPFTMQGKSMQLIALPAASDSPARKHPRQDYPHAGRIISLSAARSKRNDTP